jgi:hypothetical protein
MESDAWTTISECTFNCTSTRSSAQFSCSVRHHRRAGHAS